MKKMFAMALALMMIGMQISLPVAMATVEYGPCEVGDHVYEVEDIIEYGIRVPIDFRVDECQYSTEPHYHSRLYGCTIYVYVCMYCGDTEEYYDVYEITEMGDTCKLHDYGR